jgi:hypothetical protein
LSFRNRLTLFFVVIVVVPMVAVSLVLFRVVADSERGKTDARLAQAQRAASGLYREFQRRAGDAAETMGRDLVLADAIRGKDEKAIRERVDALAERRAAQRVLLTLPAVGRFDVGSSLAVAPNRTRLLGDGGREEGDLVVSLITADEYVRLVARTTGLDMVLSENGRLLATTLNDPDGRPVPLRGKVTIGGEEYSTAGFDAPAFENEAAETNVRLLADERETQAAVGTSPSPSRSPSPAPCRRRSSACSRPLAGSARATSTSRSRPRARTSSPPSARSSTPWRASSRVAWTS